MFDIGATELLVIAIVAILVIGPKDMPMALRTAGQWIGKVRRISSHFRSGIDTMVREAEIEEMDKKWRDRNAQIMAEHPADEMAPIDKPNAGLSAAEAKVALAQVDPPKPASSVATPDMAKDAAKSGDEPQLPLDSQK